MRARVRPWLWCLVVALPLAIGARVRADAGLLVDAASGSGPVDAGVGPAADASHAALRDAGAATPAPPSIEYSAVATATRLARPLRLVAGAVTVIPRAELALNPSLTSDSVLRSVPSVATFRRSTSLTADPSSQGLNLRGVGPSGTSRSLVLLDGVPVNDPFAGSIYWRGLPRLGLERVEIVPGGGSALYGSSALSGVVQLLSRPSARRAFEGDLSYGNLDTWFFAGRAAGGSERVSGALEGEWLRSDGYVVVAKDQRGPIDGDAHSQHGSVNGKLELRPHKRLTLALAGSYFQEKLDHSTRYTSAGVQLGMASLRARYDAGRRGATEALWFGRLSRFEQERARVAEGRVSEQRAARQNVPAGDTGGSLTWSSRDLGDALGHRALLGLDARYAGGTSHERLYPPVELPDALRTRASGGRQLLLGVFAQDLWRLHRIVQLEAALRLDLVHNARGELVRTRYSGEQSRDTFPADQRLSVNPRLGLLLEPMRALRLRASGYRSFRAATLNELYRPFQVGTVLTAANPELRPETLLGAELGLESRSWEPLTLRAVGFYNALDDPIVNATLPEALPDGSTRQRQNLKRARIAGLELGADLRLFARFSLLLSYTYADSRVTRAGSLGELLGKRLAQDPLHRFSALAFFDEPRWFSAALQLRYLGAQFEDDLNTLPMAGYATLDASLARRLFWHLELYLSGENLFDTSYLVGRAGVDTVGPPRTVRIGLRVREPVNPAEPSARRAFAVGAADPGRSSCQPKF